MNTKTLLLVGMSVIVLGAVVHFAMQSSDKLDADLVAQEDVEQVSKKDGGRGSFISLMNRGENISCTFTSTTEGVISEGVFYFSDGKYRVEAKTTANGVTFDSNMIGLEEQSYIWGSSPDGDMALIIANDATELDESIYDFADMQEGSAIDLDAGVEYDCDPWRPEAATFLPPSDIEFMDMQAMLQDIPGLPEGFEMPEGMEIPADLQMQ